METQVVNISPGFKSNVGSEGILSLPAGLPVHQGLHESLLGPVWESYLSAFQSVHLSHQYENLHKLLFSHCPEGATHL